MRVSVDRPTHDASVNVLGTIEVLEAARAHEHAGRLQLDRRRDLRRVRRACARDGRAAAARAVRRLEARRARSTWPRTTGSTGRGTSRFATATSTGRGRTRTARRAWSRSSSASSPPGEAPRIFGDGSQTRDYVYAGDVARATLAAAGQDGGVFNVGTGRETSVVELYDACRRGRRARRWMPSKRRRASASCSAACSTSRLRARSSAGGQRCRSREGLRLTWESICGLAGGRPSGGESDDPPWSMPFRIQARPAPIVITPGARSPS